MTTEIPVTQAKQGGCGCGHSHTETPVLDARQLAPAIRHGAILGALSSLAPGAQLVLVAPHDPLPLLAQIEQAHGDAIAVEYLDRAPDAVQVQFTRVG